MRSQYRLVLLKIMEMGCRVSSSFKRALKKLSNNDLFELLSTIYILQSQRVIPIKYANHRVKGNLSYQDCHVKPDLVLIYRSVGASLELARLGKHNKVFK
ncbi:type II toxin-antitoxin system RelE/ParE family toxin [Helicobacter vulpis]|uniref:type II toxin-antitoxin system RelE/ParE family toxin n=1 Tax=Helicobacter vulpis TaxID=2316076 RepID=UPI000EB25020|nr:type II toxin-antitoxin system YafQ family toxin [Helicobacter vulpis]